MPTTKAPSKTAAAKPAAAKKAPSKKAPAKAGGAFAAPLTPSKDLAAVVGDKPLARTEAVSKLWEYIKKHNLQNPENKREILADDKLKPVFDGKAKVTMFEMNKYLSPHLK